MLVYGLLKHYRAERCTHELAVEQVLLDHDDVYNLRVLERQEAETTRAACDAISHDCAFRDFAVLCEVVLERLCNE